MLLIGAIVLLLAYLSLYYATDVYELLRGKAWLEASLLVADEILNVKRELEMLPKLYLHASDEELMGYVMEFARFVKKASLAKGRETGTASMLAYTPQTVVANQSMDLKVSIFNQKLDELTDVKLEFSYGPTLLMIGRIPDDTIYNTSFTFNTNTDVDYELRISYQTMKWGYFNDTITIPVRIGERARVLLADVTFLGV
jgi:hypothetical protein